MVLPAYSPELLRGPQRRDDLVAEYFNQGYTNNEIVFALLSTHGVCISLATLKRILQRLGLRRRHNTMSPIHDIIGAILDIIEHSGQCLGYRTVWKRLCSQYNMRVTRNEVMKLMRVIDGQAVERRRKRRLLRRRYICPGPNYVWHIDGYDKLKPFGFAIHGAIDGFSRRILWLEVGRSNNNPDIIAMYYLDTVKQLGGSPLRCRCDLGTENSKLEELQTFFTVFNGADAAESSDTCFMYGKSTANQRIEAWWSILRRQASDWWINFFKNLRDDGLIRDHDALSMECLRYCFMGVLQRELNQVAILWNQHTIQIKKNNPGPRGKPDVMFFQPQLHDTIDFKISCDNDCVEVCRDMYTSEGVNSGVSGEFKELACLLLNDADVQMPVSVDDAVSLYAKLMDTIDLMDN